MAQIFLGLSGGFCPTSLPLFQGALVAFSWVSRFMKWTPLSFKWSPIV